MAALPEGDSSCSHRLCGYEPGWMGPWTPVSRYLCRGDTHTLVLRRSLERHCGCRTSERDRWGRESFVQGVVSVVELSTACADVAGSGDVRPAEVYGPGD